MKKLLYGAMALAIGIFIYSCDKEDDKNLKGGDENMAYNIVENLNNILSNIESGNSSSKLNVQLANEQNPFDNVGVQHNEVLSYLISLELTESTVCNSLTEGSREFEVEIDLNCQELLSIIDDGKTKTFDNAGNYQSDLLDELLNRGKISENEYSVVNTTIENVFNIDDINQRIESLKTSENYTLNAQFLTEIEKDRILRTFAIYRYSTYYWEVEAGKMAGPGADLADAAGEYWAMNSPDSPAQDGSDIYFISGVVSLVFDLLGF